MHLLLLCLLCFVCIFIEFRNKDNEICEGTFQKCRFYKVFWMGMILFLFAALRDTTVGIDVPRYADNYQDIAGYDFNEIFTIKEDRDPVFSVFCKVLTYISVSPNFMLCVIGAIVAFSFSYYVYHQKGDVLLSYILFVTFRLYAFTLTGLRQAMALSFCWLAFVSLQKRKNLRFFILTILASLFHVSAIVYVLMWLFYKFGKPKTSFVICLIITIIDLSTNHAIISVFSRLMTADRFDSYLEIGNEVKYSGGGTFYLYLLVFAFIILTMDLSKKNDTNLESNRLFSVTCLMMTLYIICQTIPVFFRISYYFILPFYTLFAASVNKTFKGKDLFLVRSFIVLLLSAQYIILTPGAGITDYQFFWIN